MKIVNTVDEFLEQVYQRYNELGFYWIVSNYLSNKAMFIELAKNNSALIYVLSSSLYRSGEFYELIAFSNVQLADSFLTVLVKSFVSFGFSELSNYSLSLEILSNVYSNIDVNYIRRKATYYVARNLAYMTNERFLFYLKDSPGNEIRSIDIRNFLKIYSNNFDVLINLVEVLHRKNVKIPNSAVELLNRFVRGISEREKERVAKIFLNIGQYESGYKILSELTNVHPLLRRYYRCQYFTYVNLTKNARVELVFLESNVKKLYSLGIYKGDLDYLEARISMIEKDFSVLRKFARSRDQRILLFLVQNYSRIPKELYYTALKNLSMVSPLSDNSLKSIKNFVSWALLNNDVLLLKTFLREVIPLYQNSVFYPYLGYLKYLLSESEKEKEDIVSKILLDHPFSYEYVRILENFDSYTFKSNVISNLLKEYRKLLTKEYTNLSLKEKNSIISLSVFFNKISSGDFPIEIILKIIDEVKESSKSYLSSKLGEDLWRVARLLVKNKLLYDLVQEIIATKFNDPRLLNLYRSFHIHGSVIRAVEKLGYMNGMYRYQGIQVLAFLDELYPIPYYNIVSEQVSRYNISAELVYSIMKQESRFLPISVSIANAIGLMQLIPTTANAAKGRYLRDVEIFDIRENLFLAVKHIHELFKFLKPRINDDGKLLEFSVLASYNAGTTVVIRWISKLRGNNILDPDIFVYAIGFGESRDYTRFVYENKFIYEYFKFGKTISWLFN